MATDQFSYFRFFLKGNQTDTDSTIPIEVWLSTLFNTTEISNDQGVATYFSLLIVTAIFLVFILFIGSVQFVHAYKYISVIRLKNNMYYLIFLNPISSICCLFGMTSPRNAAFMYGVILSYHMLAIRMALDIMFNINGGRVTLSKTLNMNNERIRIYLLPFRLLPKCMPSFAPTVENIFRMEMVVSQTIIVRLVLTVVDICVYRETGTLNNAWFAVSHTISLISTMIGSYVANGITGVNRENSKKFRFNYLFALVDSSQMVITYQKAGFDILHSLGFFPIIPSPKPLEILHFAESIYFLFFLYSFEVLLMSIIISYLLRPAKTYIFDKYTGPRSNPPPTYMYLEDSDEGLLPALMESDSAAPPSNPSQVQGGEQPPSTMEPPPPSQQQQPQAQSQPKGESQMKDPKEGVTVTAGPETMQKLAEVTTPEEKKIPVEGGVVDDGAYENLKSQSMRSMNKMLQDEAADDFFKVPDKKEEVAQKSTLS